MCFSLQDGGQCDSVVTLEFEGNKLCCWYNYKTIQLVLSKCCIVCFDLVYR